MPIEFACEDCGSVLRVPDGSSGKRSRCPACKHEQEIPFVVNSDDALVPSGKLSIPCPKCQHHLVCDPELVGTRGQCKKCNHIFTISTEPDSVADGAPALVFHCPECNQLFEGREDMAGRKGKCHVCQAVFMIKLEMVGSESPARAPNPAVQSPAVQSPAVQSPAGPRAAPQSVSVPISSAPSSSAPSPTPAATPAPTLKQTPAASAPLVEKPAASLRLPMEPQTSAAVPDNVNDELTLVEDASASASASRAPRETSVSSRAKPVSTQPIRFECEYCQGVMEVPGSTAGMETECPYCQVVLTIPERSTVSQKPAPTKPATNSFDEIYASAKSQPAYNQPATASASFNNLDFGTPTNPYAAPAAAWSAPVGSVSRRSNELTIGNVLQQGFEGLFPSCFVAIPLLIIVFIPMVMAQAVLGAVVAMKLGLGVTIGASFVVWAIGLVLGAWFSGALSRTALHAVRGKPLSFGQCFDPGGGFAAALFQSICSFLFTLLFYVPALINYLAPGVLRGEGMLVIVLIWIFLVFVLLLSYTFLSCLAVPAGADGEDPGTAIQLSCSLVMGNFLTTFAVLFITGLITIVLIIPTLGMAAVIPIYMLASLYNLASK